MRRSLVAAALAAALSAAHGQQPAPPEAVQASGRMLASADGWRATWPGVSWSLRFEGTALGVRLDDAVNHWVLEIDGRPALQIAPEPGGERTDWLRGLPPGEHRALLVKRTESALRPAHVIGFELDGGRVLPPPPRPTWRIEFIGDSYTAALGNLSTTRACSEAETGARTDITQGFAVLTARALGAEWRIHARTGAGLVRNWAGSRPGETLGTDYARQLQSDPTSRVIDDGWVPDIVVIGLGTNDLSTPVKPEEPRDAAQLDRDIRSAYRALLADVHRRAGEPVIVLLSLPLGNGDQLRPLVAQMQAEEQAAGHRAVVRLDWGTLRGQGCGSHPDREDHQRMSALLLQALREAGVGH